MTAPISRNLRCERTHCDGYLATPHGCLCQEPLFAHARMALRRRRSCVRVGVAARGTCPWSDAGAVDPEEAFVAALSSCHMLWFLSLATGQGFIVNSYEDQAVGHMREIAPQRLAITQVVLRPRVVFDP